MRCIWDRYTVYFTFTSISVLFYFILYEINNIPKSQMLPKMRFFNASPFSNAYEESIVYADSKKSPESTKIKYILQWTSPENVPFLYMGNGREVFLTKSCKYTNCYVTSNLKYFDDITNFDVILFHGPEVIHMGPERLPTRRSQLQKFAFASIESSQIYPICRRFFQGYFNWTWTYKLDSDLRWGYIVVRNARGDIIGPKVDMHWIDLEDMEPVSHELIEILKKKSKAAAWFVSNCHTINNRKETVEFLQKELQKYNLSVDIYGECGNLTCGKDDHEQCGTLLERDYYFYLAFENAMSEDYVTEKVLHGLQNNAVPIVYGGANYSRFLPEGSYLNAKKLDAGKLAKTMHNLIHDLEKYSQFFRWKSHYSFHKQGDTVETDEYCNMCALLNNESLVKKQSTYNNIKKWWNPSGYKCEDNPEGIFEELPKLDSKEVKQITIVPFLDAFQRGF